MQFDSEHQQDEYAVLIEADNSKHKKRESSLAELIKQIILISLGCFFAYKSVSAFAGACRSQGEAAMAVISAAIWGIGAGICFANQLLDKVGQWMGDAIFMPSKKFSAPAEQLSPIKGLINAEEFPEAIQQLDAILKRKPFEPEPYLMLIEIYLEHLDNREKVIDMIQQYFAQQLKIAPENIEMLMIYSDTCQELGMTRAAIDLLSHEAERNDYSTPDKHAIAKRLNSILE